MWPMHLAILPILIPLFAGLLQLLQWGENPQPIRRTIGIIACLLQLVVSIALLLQVQQHNIIVYALGNWQAPFGIVLSVDRLSSLMVLLTAVLALPVLLYACFGIDNLGSHFQALFQFQLMGIYGAFLTGDLFNLFVFFEVLLISSYALLMHGGGKFRIRACLHYVLINLAGSALFLIALGILYGSTGTLNIADMAQKVALLQGDDAAIAKAGALLLLVVFGIKAAILPLHFWLPQAYSTTSGVVAALFAIMTKVGIYAIARVYTLIFGANAGVLAMVGNDWIWVLGLLTLVVGAIGVMSSRDLRMLVAYLVVISVGTMMATLSFANERAISAVFFYLVHSTLITGALFLLADVMSAQRGKTASRIVSGRRMAQHSLLAVMFFVAAIAVIGIPPLSGFIGKLFILEAARMGNETALLWPIILVSSLVVIITMARAGSKMFWHTLSGKPGDSKSPTGQLVAISLLLSGSVLMTVFAQPISEFTTQLATDLVDGSYYMQAVLPTTEVATHGY
ncbi:monovalent cation/H+ antiporter subunit D [Idiomarina xiamenensis]|uniref:Monovalent cation/H+ antiporter subunit D n=1 Tax=Idiomarina xiamenensis 10-D-4 TaxID=740709 RepID=K2KMF0_9GAMM|nr:monovalent cation/H+ antiporter subunit D [Idiomarina xiamenensis]EKE83629.1 monovalent cation/H+ antiporter subunit D [Idiomarina xiamenensis 10-D-4]